MVKIGSGAYIESAIGYCFDSDFAAYFWVPTFSTASLPAAKLVLVVGHQHPALVARGARFRRPRALKGAYRRGLFA